VKGSEGCFCQGMPIAALAGVVHAKKLTMIGKTGDNLIHPDPGRMRCMLMVVRQHQRALASRPNIVVSNENGNKNVVIIDDVDQDLAADIERGETDELAVNTILWTAEGRRRLAKEILTYCVWLDGRTSGK
jgi:hypothetical protein